MRSALEQKLAVNMAKAASRKVKIQVSVERLKKMVYACQKVGNIPDDLVEVKTYAGDGEYETTKVPAWTTVKDEETVPFVNFANLFLYGGGMSIDVVEEEVPTTIITL